MTHKFNEKELLELIAKNAPITDPVFMPNINTPRIPDEVFTIIYKQNGEEFKRYLEADKFIPWIASVAEKSNDPEADISEKCIARTKFYDQCENALKTIESNIKQDDGLMSGFVWNYNGDLKSVSLSNEQISDAVNAFTAVVQSAVKPRIVESVADMYDRRDNQSDYRDIISGKGC